MSTRYDLNQPVYQDFITHIDLITQQYNYEINDYNYLNNDFVVSGPTPEELQKADKYKNKVPDYKISSGGGNIHVGVVLDDPAYSSYDLNKPPEVFTSIGADVSLKKSQINANGLHHLDLGKVIFNLMLLKIKMILILMMAIPPNKIKDMDLIPLISIKIQ